MISYTIHSSIPNTAAHSAPFGDFINTDLMPWKDMAGHIELNCPHLKSVWLSGERLRKKEFYTEKQRRKAILRRWQANFTAFSRYGRTKWYERMPCLCPICG